MITQPLTIFPERLVPGFLPTGEKRSRLLGVVDRINLAPLRYAYASAGGSGPIARVEAFHTPLNGEEFYTVNAYLRDEVVGARTAFSYYSSADGTGTRRSMLKARLVAISEAIERWAYFKTVRSPQRDYYGFDVDQTSNGMAAFPGLTSRAAREHAWKEAVERFVMFSWWEGRLHGESSHLSERGCDVVRIENPYTEHEVVIVHQEVGEKGLMVYGFGAGNTFDDAVESACIEMTRHRWVVEHFVKENPVASLGLARISDLFERRSLYFALPEGSRLFRERLHTDPWSKPGRLQVCFDGAIYGPWDAYATVWRTAIRPPSEAFRADRLDYFFW